MAPTTNYLYYIRYIVLYKLFKRWSRRLVAAKIRGWELADSSLCYGWVRGIKELAKNNGEVHWIRTRALTQVMLIWEVDGEGKENKKLWSNNEISVIMFRLGLEVIGLLSTHLCLGWSQWSTHYGWIHQSHWCHQHLPRWGSENGPNHNLIRPRCCDDHTSIFQQILSFKHLHLPENGLTSDKCIRVHDSNIQNSKPIHCYYIYIKALPSQRLFDSNYLPPDSHLHSPGLQPQLKKKKTWFKSGNAATSKQGNSPLAAGAGLIAAMVLGNRGGSGL